MKPGPTDTDPLSATLTDFSRSNPSLCRKPETSNP